MSNVTSCLQDLVSIPSPNPPGDTRKIAAYIADRLGRVGGRIVVSAPPAKEAAASVVATIGNGDGPRLVYHAHIDTVPATHAHAWLTDPYQPAVRNGRLYGLGSVDDKGPLAAMIVALERLAGRPLRGSLTVVAAAEEEVGGQLGTRWLVENGLLPESDFVVVGEQTLNRVATANKGVMRATIRTQGRSAHATNPDRGVNAIERMARVVLALAEYHRSLATRAHRLLGAPTCNVGVIRGGLADNMVPDVCEIRVDRRMLPGESAEAVRAELQAVISGLALGDPLPEIFDFLLSAPFESRADSGLAQTFLTTVESILKSEPGPIGYLPGSDAKHLISIAKQGMVVFGPGSYEAAHAPNEHVAVSELEQASDILYEFAVRVLVQEGAR